jgi:hypothetical protein
MNFTNLNIFLINNQILNETLEAILNQYCTESCCTRLNLNCNSKIDLFRKIIHKCSSTDIKSRDNYSMSALCGTLRRRACRGTLTTSKWSNHEVIATLLLLSPIWVGIPSNSVASSRHVWQDLYAGIHWWIIPDDRLFHPMHTNIHFIRITSHLIPPLNLISNSVINIPSLQVGLRCIELFTIYMEILVIPYGK